MPNIVRPGTKIIMTGVFAVFFVLAVACGTAATTTEEAQPASPTAAPAPPAATAVPPQPTPVTAASEPPASSTAVSEQASAAETEDDERPILKAGVIWLDSPLDPVESGWIANQSGMSENLFRLSGTTLSPC